MIEDLYQDIILDHNRNPRNFGPLAQANRSARGYNPLCGDKVEVQLQVDGDRITAVGFQGSGCAISTASASMMTQKLTGATIDEAESMFARFHDLLTEGDAGEAQEDDEELGELEVFAGVRRFPMRVKCATLAWHALRAALSDQGEEGPVKTEA